MKRFRHAGPWRHRRARGDDARAAFPPGRAHRARGRSRRRRDRAPVRPRPLSTATGRRPRDRQPRPDAGVAARDARRGEATLPATRREGAAAVYFTACVNRIFGHAPGHERATSIAEALVAVSLRAGLPLWIPEDVGGHCCATIWHSKGYERGNALMANRTLESLWRWSDGGQLPIVCDASSCSLGLTREIVDYLTPENRARHARAHDLSIRLPGRTTGCCRSSRSRARSRRRWSIRAARPSISASRKSCMRSRPRWPTRRSRRHPPSAAVSPATAASCIPSSRSGDRRRGRRGRGPRRSTRTSAATAPARSGSISRPDATTRRSSTCSRSSTRPPG